MKKFLAVAVIAVLAGAGFGLFSHSPKLETTFAAVTGSPDANAQSSQPQGYSQTPVIALHWEKLGVAAGAVIQTPVLKLDNVNSCIAYADNSAGGSTRALTANCIGADGTTVIYGVSNTVGISGRGLTAWGASVAAASLPTGVVIQPGGTCKKMQFTLAAAGAAAGSLAVDCR